uniref:Major capsid protein n=1 Tax=Alkalimonas phage phiMOD2.32-OM TaxID=1510621 RepID=A0A075IC93_9VIRU|nr:major capsid protein [Alkalimonas phage phiMOD2.32-OM]
MELKELADQLNAASTEIKNAQAKLQDELKTVGSESAETKAALAEAQKSYDELKGLFGKMDEKLIDLEQKAKRPGFGMGEKKLSLGDYVVESQEFKAGGKTLYVELERKDITGAAGSAGALTRPDRDPEVYRNPSRATRIRDLIPSTPATSNAVEFMRQNVFTNNAGPQGTVAGIAGGELATKNESNITWELVQKVVPTIAHWVPASRQILSDAPMLSSLINLDLSYGLDLESDKQLLLGDGTGQNMTGLLVDAGVSTVGQITAGRVSEAGSLAAAMIDHIRRAVTECQKHEYYNIGGVVLNPEDFETLETAKATNGHYILVPFAATNGQTQQIWRVPVIITNAMPKDNFLLGDWSMGARVRDRESVGIRVAEQHGELFVKNGVVVLAEERYVLTIPRPKAFTKGLFTVA